MLVDEQLAKAELTKMLAEEQHAKAQLAQEPALPQQVSRITAS
jgi:hypothetical protein